MERRRIRRNLKIATVIGIVELTGLANYHYWYRERSLENAKLYIEAHEIVGGRFGDYLGLPELAAEKFLDDLGLKCDLEFGDHIRPVCTPFYIYFNVAHESRIIKLGKVRPIKYRDCIEKHKSEDKERQKSNDFGTLI